MQLFILNIIGEKRLSIVKPKAFKLGPCVGLSDRPMQLGAFFHYTQGDQCVVIPNVFNRKNIRQCVVYFHLDFGYYGGKKIKA